MLSEILEKLHADGYAIIDQVLNNTELKLINEAYFVEKNLFSPAKVGYGAEKIRNEAIRGDYTQWLDPKFPKEFLQKPTLLLKDLKAELNQHFYLGIKDFEYHLAYYPAKFFYQKHTDAFEKDSSRVVSFVFYLNESWGPDDGGELILYQQNGVDKIQSIHPLPGRLVIFLSRDFPHEVCPANKERRSLTGWMHNKILE